MSELHLVSTPRDGSQRPAPALASALRAYFDTGATKPMSWRLSQLDAIGHFLMEREQDIFDALHADLGKPATEAFTGEVGITLTELRLARKKLASWMKPERVRTSAVAMPGRSYIYREPLGVTLIIGAWNYPLQLVVLPLVGAIAAGNCAVLKPSEVAPNVSALLAKWLSKYLDPKAVQVVEGGIPETTALLRENWDHIFYTGNGTVGRIVIAGSRQTSHARHPRARGKEPVHRRRER